MERNEEKPININTGDMKRELDISISRAMYYVSFGINSCENEDSFNPYFPEAFIKFGPPVRLKGTIEDMKTVFKDWIILNGLKDIVETIGITLEHARFILLVVSNTGNDKVILADDIAKQYRNDFKKFHRMGLPEKIEYLERKYNGFDIPDSKKYLLSINKARNCLVHRSGIVTPLETNNNREFNLIWECHYPSYINDKGEKIVITKPMMTAKGSLQIGREDFTKKFSLGQKISFSAVEFLGLCQSLWLFGNDLLIKINEYGELFGLDNPDKKSNSQ